MRYQATDKSGQVWQYKNLPVINFNSDIWFPSDNLLGDHICVKIHEGSGEAVDWELSLIDLWEKYHENLKDDADLQEKK